MADGIEPQSEALVTKPLSPQARYRAKHKAKRNAANKLWWQKNGAEYRAKNRKRLREISAKWRDTHRDIARERVSRFQRENPARQRASEIKYRAKHPDRRKKSCAEYRSNPVNREKERIAQKVWAAANKEHLAIKAAARRSLKLRATPAWADLEAIAAIYIEAARLTRDTGIEHHVDHIYPLKSKWLCGLHCEANLQIIAGLDNLKKSNRIWPGMEWSTHPTIIP